MRNQRLSLRLYHSVQPSTCLVVLVGVESHVHDGLGRHGEEKAGDVDHLDLVNDLFCIPSGYVRL